MDKHDIKIYPRFNRQFFQDLWGLIKPYWCSNERTKATLYLVVNLLCSFCGLFASVALNNITKTMFDALSAFNKSLLISSSLEFLAMAVLIFFCAGYGAYFSGLLSMHWQKWLTNQTLQKWLAEHSHYKMHWLEQQIDNPDQRIAEDLGALPMLTLKIFFLLLNSLGSFIAFSVILWRLSSSFPLIIGNIHLTVPGYLFFSATLYGILGLWIIGLIGKKLAQFEYRQQLFSADFRARLIRIREFGEQVSLFRGESVEINKCAVLFEKIYQNFLRANYLRKNLLFFTIGFEILTQIVGIFLAMPLFLAKKVQYGGMMQISGAFVSVVRAFSNIMDAFGSLAELKAVVYRLTEFNKAITLANTYEQDGLLSQIIDEPVMQIDSLKIEYFDGNAMLSVNNVFFKSPHRYLITGVSGLGKSTFLKTVLGLWPHASGHIYRPGLDSIFMLPQRSYLPEGTLREVLSYPHQELFSDEQLIYWLQQVELDAFIHRLDEVANWALILSLGQQQLIGFIRLFLQKPQIICLDESTSALDEFNQQKMYNLIRDLFPTSCVISIGHRSSLKSLHDYEFKINNKELVALEVC